MTFTKVRSCLLCSLLSILCCFFPKFQSKLRVIRPCSKRMVIDCIAEYCKKKFPICTLQSLTGKYREIQGKPCNQNREPAMRTGFPCNESRFFPVGIDLQGKAVSCTGFGFTVYIFKYMLRTYLAN